MLPSALAVISVAMPDANAIPLSPQSNAPYGQITPAAATSKPSKQASAPKKSTAPAKPQAKKSADASPTPTSSTPQPATTPIETESPAQSESPKVSLEKTRLTLNKWIETQQIISKERNDWQQGKEVLQGRAELVAKEVDVLKGKISTTEVAVVESNKKRDELVAENELLTTATAQLVNAVTVMEKEVRQLATRMPDPVREKLAPLLARIPEGTQSTRVSAAERFQNVLGILNELNKVNSELTVTYEIRKLADGSSSEVQVLYVGLAQAYYISPRGDAGIGRPSENGWVWESIPATSPSIILALEILQGKHSPSFVPLPMKIQ